MCKKDIQVSWKDNDLNNQWLIDFYLISSAEKSKISLKIYEKITVSGYDNLTKLSVVFLTAI